MLLGKELLQLCQSVLLAHQEEAFPLELLSRRDLGLRVAEGFGRRRFNLGQVRLWCLKFIEDQLIFGLLLPYLSSNS